MTVVASDYLITFFTTQTANVTTAPVSVPYNTGVLKLWGTWGGATIQIETGVPGSTVVFIPVTDANGNPLTFSQNTQITLQDIVWGDNMVVVLAGATGTTSLNATLQRI